MTTGIDLSVGACVTLAGVIASLVMDPANGGCVPLALAACVGAAVAVGLVNGLLIVRYNLPPFLATLGMTSFLAGMNLYLRGVTLHDRFRTPLRRAGALSRRPQS